MTIKNKLYSVFIVTLMLFSISVTSFFIVINNFKDFAEVKIANSLREADLVQILLNENHSLMLKINEVLLVIHGMEIGHELLSQSSMINSMTEMVGQTKDLGKHIRYCQVIYKKDDSEVREFRKIENNTNEIIKSTYLFIEMWQDGRSSSDIVQYYQEYIHSQLENNEVLLAEQYDRSLYEVMEQQDKFIILLADGQNIIALSATVIFILIFSIVFRNSRSISRPLEKLKEQALAISNGNYDVQIKVRSNDEIGQLAEAFNHMTATISEEMKGRKRAEEAQRRSQKMDAIGQLTGGIAHDFNNILAVMIGNLEILEQLLPADENIRKRTAAMNRAGQRAIDLTKQLLSFSRRQVTQQSVTDINQLIPDMESLIAHSLTPEVEVEHQFSSNLWLTEIDSGDFEDALLNLCINARDAMDGHGHLTIETNNITLDDAYCAKNIGARPGQYVQLSVSDNGVGMPLELQEHIFEPFFTTKDQGKGTGLGLAMVYGFVKRSDGYVNVYSEDGIGTTVKLYLPRSHGEERLAEQNDGQTESLPHGQETILAVDDEAMLLELTQESLEVLGYRVLTANDGRQALALLDEEPGIDLLFSDVVMPGGINGYDLAEQATAKRPELKVLLTSGYTEKVMAKNGSMRFNENLLSKPYSRADLARRVRAILDA